MDIKKEFEQLLQPIGKGYSQVFWDKVVEIEQEVIRLQRVEQSWEQHKKDQLFTWQGNVFKGFGNKASAWATYYIHSIVALDYVEDMVRDALPFQTEYDVIALGETLKDFVIYSHIYPEGLDDKCDPSEIQEHIIDAMLDDVSWTELASKWAEELRED